MESPKSALLLPPGTRPQTKPVVVKENGAKQRVDVALSASIAHALRDRVLQDKPLMPSDKHPIDVEIGEGEEKKAITISSNTIATWIARGTVIPETGETLRAFIEKARMEKRIIEHKTLVSQVEKKFIRTMGLETREPAVGMFGIIKDPETKKPIMKENVRLLEVQMRTAQFIAERLDPAIYAPRSQTSTHMHITMGDLRRAKEEQEAAEV